MKSDFRSRLAVLCVIAFSVVGLSHAGQGHGPKVVKKMPYAAIAPLLKAQCISCHNSKNHPEKVDFSSYDAIMKSGERGPIVVPGHPEKSKLMMYVDGSKQPRMPYKKAPLSAASIQLLKVWISLGAINKP